MPELHFKIEAAEAGAARCRSPDCAEAPDHEPAAEEPIHTLTLRCQVQIEPAKRRYVPQEQEKLLDLFGTPERWSRTVRPLLWDEYQQWLLPGIYGQCAGRPGASLHF